jgi:hypothetical protein
MAWVMILRSYRWRRRLLFTVVPLAILGPLIYLGVHLSTPGNPENANGPTVPDYKAPTPARFTKANQRAVHRVLASFVKSAVARQNPARSWELAAPSLKEGVTRKEWNRGDLPVVPYPTLDRGLGRWDYVEYSYKESVGLEVFLFPKPGSGYSAMTADVELVKGHNGQWLVDYWMPKKFHGPPALAKSGGKSKKITRKAAGKRSHTPGKAKAAPPAQATDNYRAPHASRAYWAIPAAILSLIVLIPIGLGTAHWLRGRKAKREYEAWQASRSRDAA